MSICPVRALPARTTYRLCEEIIDQGAGPCLGDNPDAGAGSPAFAKLLERLPGEGVPLHRADEFDLPALERYWADNFTNVDHQTLIAYKKRIDDLMAGTAATFGTAEDSASPVAAE